MFLEEQVDVINQKLDTVTPKENILIWGAGESTLRLFQYTKLLLYKVSYIIDNRLYGQFLFGKTVMKPASVSWEDIDVVIIAVFAGIDAIKNELSVKYGFKGKIITVHDGLPVPFYQLVTKREITPLSDKEAFILQKNSKYKDIHAGERGFILCTGPSIKSMDLIRLKNEKTIAVNSFYLHKECNLISPDYYCVPTVDAEFNDDVRKKFLSEVQQSVLDTTFFYSITENEIIEKMEEYKYRNVNYMSFSFIPNYINADIDLTGLVMGPQSVSIMALELALYMGFQEIYLLGTEHDNWITQKYTHFYDYKESIISRESESESAQGDELNEVRNILKCNYNLWRQYQIIKQIAERKGTKIYNATKGGVLDIFERVDYDTLF